MRDLITFLILAILGLAAWYYVKFELPGTKQDSKPGKGPDEPDTPFPLKKGDTKPEVSKLQLYLNVVHDAGLLVDKQFGEQTETAVKEHMGNVQVTAQAYKKLRGRAEEELPNSNYISRIYGAVKNSNLQQYLPGFDSFTGEGQPAPYVRFEDAMNQAIQRGLERSQFRNQKLNYGLI